MTGYYTVRLGRLDPINGPAEYQFPTRKAATTFAGTNASLNPGRVVIVRDPQRRVIKKFGKTLTRRSK